MLGDQWRHEDVSARCFAILHEAKLRVWAEPSRRRQKPNQCANSTLDRPNLFEANHRPPNFNFVKDAAHAVSHATMLSVSSFAMGITATAWLMDIGSIREFSIAMKNKLGGAKRELELSQLPVDPEVADIEKSLTDALK